MSWTVLVSFSNALLLDAATLISFKQYFNGIFFFNEDVINAPFSLRNYPRDLRVGFPKDLISFFFLVADCENGEDTEAWRKILEKFGVLPS